MAELGKDLPALALAALRVRFTPGMLLSVALLCKSMQDRKAALCSSWHSTASSLLLLRKKTHCDVNLCFLALPFTHGAAVNQRHMGYISLERHSQVRKQTWQKALGEGGFSTSRALQHFPEMLHSSTHPHSVWGSSDLTTPRSRHCTQPSLWLGSFRLL